MQIILRGISAFFVFATLGFSGVQLYMDRKTAAIEANAALIALATDPDRPARAKRWALENLAACGALQDYTLAKPDLDVELGCSRWGVDLAGATFGPYTAEERLLCPGGEEDTASDRLVAFFYEETRLDTKFENSNFNCVDFSGAYLEKAAFALSQFRGVSFHKANLTDSTWTETALRFADFGGATLTGATFSGSKVDLTGASFRGADLTGAVFSDSVNLNGVSFIRATLTGADFSAAVQLNDPELFDRACVVGDQQPKWPEREDGSLPALEACEPS